MPSITNLEEEEIVDASGNDGNVSIPEQVKRPNPWRKMMMMITTVLFGKNVATEIYTFPYMLVCYSRCKDGKNIECRLPT